MVPVIALEGQELNQAIRDFGLEAPTSWEGYHSLAHLFYNWGAYDLAYDAVNEWYKGAEQEGKPPNVNQDEWDTLQEEAAYLLRVVTPKTKGDMLPVDEYDAGSMAKAAYLNGDYVFAAECLIIGISLSKMVGNQEVEEYLSTGLLQLVDELGMERADLCSKLDLIGC
ncbi:MAG: hypothetical protein AB4038_05125 [Prochloraceae cyanobacterium]